MNRSRFVLLALLLLVVAAVPCSAVPLTAVDVARAHAAGVSEATLLALIGNAAEVAPVKEEADAALVAAGVPEAVRAALVARGGRPIAAVRPDDPRLEEVAKLAASGVPVDVVKAHIQATQPPFVPTANDLIFLQQSGVSDELMAAFYAKPALPVAAAPTAAVEPVESKAEGSADDGAGPTLKPAPIARDPPPTELLTYGPLLLMTRAGKMFPRDTLGTLLLGTDYIEWRDDEKPGLSASMKAAVLEKVELECEKGASGPTCYELKLKTVHGDSYRFRDPNWKGGNNDVITAVYNALKTQYPGAKYKMDS